MIQRFEESKSYNPIRSHINLVFSIVDDYDMKIPTIAKNLLDNNFDANSSRVLIFVSSRKRSEEAAEELSKSIKGNQSDYWDKVDFYHAGLESSERESKYDKYKNGEIVILFATKAFGMGMDIPNIHFVYHLDPSSNFEDFLQEVGRAGRNEKSYLEAGFSENNKIIANCIIAQGDFKSLKDKLHSYQITWGHIIQVQKTVYDYVSKFVNIESSEDQVFALPLDLLSQFIEYDDSMYDTTFFRVVLYWLERLKRVKLGTFTPTFIPISIIETDQNYSVVKDQSDVAKLKKLCSEVKNTFTNRSDTKKYYMVSIEDLKSYLDVESVRDVWGLLFLGQKANALKVEREIILEPTRIKKDEMEAWNSDTIISPTIATVFDFAKELMYSSKYNQQTHFEGEDLDQIMRAPIQQFLIPEMIFWNQNSDNKQNSDNENIKEEIAAKLRVDFHKKRAKVAFKLIQFLPDSKHKSIIQTQLGDTNPKVTQLIFNGYKDSSEWELYLGSFKKDLTALIKYIHDKFINENIRKFNIVDLLIKLNIESKGEDYFNELVYVTKGLGYLKGNCGGLIPMGIELFILDNKLVSEDNLVKDESIVKQEFEESNKMKELRLLALDCMSTSVSAAKQDIYIKEYFKCGSLTDLVNLLEEYFGEDHEKLSAFRSEALQFEVDKLNEDQKCVYDEMLHENLQVVAGPGSGKTHTLTLRVARLIQEDKIKPENILVLAYNRAVVVELKYRLNKLFSDLGYGKLIKRLKVFTFHGFCKYSLGHELEGLSFDEWTPKFLELARKYPGKISQKLGMIKYVFVDEFQDITKHRLELLKFIANPKDTKVCVIGDPNQSIYGYDRVNEGGQRSPQPYYDEFNKVYKPKSYNLSVNYRSYPQILEKADDLLSINVTKFKMPPMKAFHNYDGGDPICEFYDYNKQKVDWKSKLLDMVIYPRDNGEHYNNIGVMFRSNQEVYKAFNDVRKLKLDGVMVRIQGSKGSLSSTREFHYLLLHIKEKFKVKLSHDYFNDLLQLKQPLLDRHPNWDEYLINVFLCIVFEFDKEKDENSTFKDLYDFINDISSKDDGQFGKVYQQNIKDITGEDSKREIVLTTMHKVKGLEYDAVLIPPSFSNLPQNVEHFTGDLGDLYEEERRLYYVAYTRARYKLIVIKWKREEALYNSIPKICEILTQKQVESNMGVLLEEGIDKFTLYWGASKYGKGSFQIINNQVKIGDNVRLKKSQRSGVGYDFSVWEVLVNEHVIGQLSKNIPRKLNELNELNEIQGFIVSSIYVHTYENTINSETGSKFANKWTDESIERGYIYLIDFSGYGKIINYGV